jgi:hypothetical protein
VQSFFAAVKALSRKEVHYGAHATSEQVLGGHHMIIIDLGVDQSIVKFSVFIHCLCKLPFLLNDNLLIFDQFADLLFRVYFPNFVCAVIYIVTEREFS